MVGVICTLIVSGLGLLWISSFKIPALNTFEERKVSQSTKIYDRTGEILLYDVHENIQRTVVPYNEISRHIKNATVAIEDAEFYKHNGIKIGSFIRAILVNLRAGEFKQGGSTITQQVIKNSLLTTEKEISRKLKEWVLAVKLEKEFSKEEILALYLNESPYGGSIYGIEEASQLFLGKNAKDLSIAESAYLAALPQAPTYYSPYGANRDKLEERKNLVLSRMRTEGFITEEEYNNAIQEIVVFEPRAKIGIRAPHFVFYVIEELEKKYGQKAIEEKGFKVITTLDYHLQEKGEEIVKDFALQNAETFKAENAALVAIDPKSGDILTMVGSRDYFDTTIDGNFNIITAHRQPGSAFKPFVYATAFKKGYTPDTVVFDLETEFSTECTPTGNKKYPSAVCYKPQNYTDTFVGPVSLRDALAQSMNIPAIKTLYLAGINDSLRTARDLGITSLTNSDQYGLTLVLGGGEVSPLEITSAYGVFANEGMKNTHRAILSIEDSIGNKIFEAHARAEKVMDEEIVRNISDVLSDNTARAPLFGSNSLLYFPNRDVAVKTGTTNDYRDAWIIGYAPNIAVGAWVGNNDNKSMNGVAGLRVSPMWRSFMDAALASLPNEEFVDPRPYNENIKPILRGVWLGNTLLQIDIRTNLPSTDITPIEFTREDIVPSVHSILYWVDPKDPLGAPPQNPSKQGQFVNWEYGVLQWARAHNLPS